MDFNTFINKFPIRLNAQQRSAVQAVEGAVLLLAVPGSGKTTVLVARLGYMIYCCGIKPENILTLTYTVAAAKDMRERFSSFFGAELGAGMKFRTINSICAGIINYYGKQLGKKVYELLSDEKVILGILSSIYQKIENEYPTQSDLKEIRKLITYIKNMMLSEDEIKVLEKDAGVHLLEIYKAYRGEMRSRRQMDFDDQMIYAFHLLKSNEQLLSYFQNLYPYICVDEAQDTSKIQHEIIALLASRSENIFMVGDEDQSIYGFRAAYPEALLSFEKDHPNAKVLLMEENFRSNANIVEAADRFIQKNTLRHEKHMKAARAIGSEIKDIALRSRTAQYSYLIKVAEDCRNQTAVLYRDNESVIPLVDMLERGNIPYRIRNAELSFFTHRVVMDVQNIMRFAADMQDADLFEQIYYKISTYLTRQAARSVCAISREEGISVFDAIADARTIKPHTKKHLKALQTHFIYMRNETPSKAIDRIVQYMGYKDYMERTGLSDAKLSIIKAIASKENTIDGFLNRMAELKDIIQNKKNDAQCPFILSTIHGSKGLEYDNVYMMDVMDGIFPEKVPSDLKHISSENLQIYEEERRLFYVGVTRAKENLYIFKINNQSTFCRQLLYKKHAQQLAERQVKRQPAKPQIRMKNNPYGRSKREYSEAEYQTFVDSLAEGLVVSHKKFGEGVIVAMDDNNAAIQFGDVMKQFNIRILFQNGLLKEL